MKEEMLPSELQQTPGSQTDEVNSNGKPPVERAGSGDGESQGEQVKEGSKEGTGAGLNPNDDLLTPEDVNFTKEDILLYVFCAILMVFLGAFFWTTQTRLEKNLLEEESKDAPAVSSVPPGPMDFYSSYLQTQSVISDRRYRYGARILLTNSTRKNTGFMVGTMIALLGCIMVIRRVRKMPITADFAASEKAKLRVITSSPGVFVTLLGSLIILSTILRYDSFELADAVIQPPGRIEVVGSTPAPSPEATAPPNNDGGNKGSKTPVIPDERRKKLEESLKEYDEELKGVER